MTRQPTLTRFDLNCLEWFVQHANASELKRAIRLLRPQIPPPPMCPHRPTPRQAVALALNDFEVLAGGAAGGGKSDYLLLAAAQYVDRPGYAALLLRRTFADLNLPGALMDRAKTWWMNVARWSEKSKTFTFPSGATITFGYLEHEDDKFRYQGSEFQFVGFDELTQFTETQYLYLLSRLRRLLGVDIPLRARGATNPGGVGHRWVKRRFIPADAVQALLSGSYEHVYAVGDCRFVPFKMADNPNLDVDEYGRSLSLLDPVTRARLKFGDWQADETGLIDAAWVRSYRAEGHEYLLLGPEGNVVRSVPIADARRFSVVDCAASAEEISRERRRGRASQSVVVTVDYFPAGANAATGQKIPPAWIVADCRRGAWAFPELRRQVLAVNGELRPGRIGIEDEKTGRALIQDLYDSAPVAPLLTGGRDKVTRAAPLMNAMERGWVQFPAESSWRDELVDELLFWHGFDDEPADHIDTLAYAVRDVETLAFDVAASGELPFLMGGLH
mgnify:CR=1 FL=1